MVKARHRTTAADLVKLAGALRRIRGDPFTLEHLAPQFKLLGWPPCDELKGYWYDFAAPGVERFTLDVTVPAATAPLDFWVPGDEDGTRAEYDARFDGYLAALAAELGAPTRQGTDASEEQLRSASWPLTGAVLILEQSNYDPQFGIQTLVILHALLPGGGEPALPVTASWS